MSGVLQTAERAARIDALDLTAREYPPHPSCAAGLSLTNISQVHIARFTCDALNRISQATTQATTGQYCWGQDFTIDIWSNLYRITVPSTHSSCTVEQLNLSATASNRLSGLGYDTARGTRPATGWAARCGAALL